MSDTPLYTPLDTSSQTYAIIDANGLVINIIAFDSKPDYIAAYPECTAVLCTDNVGIGWTYTNNSFINPNPPPVITDFIPISQQPSLQDLQGTIQLLQQQLATLMESK